jgi:uncharacterized membrane protein
MKPMHVVVALLLVMIVHPAALRAEDRALPPPVAIVSNVLQLSEAQTEALITMIQNRDAAVRPIAQAVQQNQEALGKLLQSASPDPAALGQLLLAIHEGEKEEQAAALNATLSFVQTLTADQLQRLQFIRQAAPVAPALPAFTAVGLL